MHYDTPDRSFKDLLGSGTTATAATLLAYTPSMKKRLTQRLAAMLDRSLAHFPELRGQTITVGYTRRHLGSATITSRRGVITRLVIRLGARRVTYQTIGHELTHLIQGLPPRDRPAAEGASHSKVPCGEKQCDIWTLARHELFCDDAPTYLRLPRVVRESWPLYARSVRALCIAAVEKRKIERRYIRWLEAEIGRLIKLPLQSSRTEQQLDLPFGP